MATVSRQVSAPCERVWEVLADGWLYSAWVVGAARIRDVDATWPQVGARLHHSVGVWPLLLDDVSEVRTVEPGRRLLLRARGWPMGEADIDLRLGPASADAAAGSAGPGCQLTMHEEPVSGPGLGFFNPLTDRALALRNTESLGRLARIAEGHARRG